MSFSLWRVWAESSNLSNIDSDRHDWSVSVGFDTINQIYGEFKQGVSVLWLEIINHIVDKRTV
jgi:hypothetical protein